MKTPLESWLDRVNLMRARAERLDAEARQARTEYHAALNELGDAPREAPYAVPVDRLPPVPLPKP